METIMINEKQWAMACHLGALAGFIFPFGNIIVPLIIWMSKKDKSHIVDAHGKASLNFQLTITLYILLSVMLIFVLIGIPLLILLGFAQLVFVVLATIKADEGILYKYPFSIRFID